MCVCLLGSALLFGIIWYISGCPGKSSTINHTLILLIKTKSKFAKHGHGHGDMGQLF